MLAAKLKGTVTPKRKLVVDVPASVKPGPVEVILLQDSDRKSKARLEPRRSKHPAFGLWVDRHETIDPVKLAAKLRDKVERRRDGRA